MPQVQENVSVEKATCVAVSCAATTTEIVAANPTRVSVLIYNAGSQTVYLEPTGAATTAGSMPLAAGASFEEREFVGVINGISASGSQDLRVWESG